MRDRDWLDRLADAISSPWTPAILFVSGVSAILLAVFNGENQMARQIVQVTHHLPGGDKSWVVSRAQIHDSTRGSIRFTFNGEEVVLIGNASITHLYTKKSEKGVK